jgi:hypothetical protein
MRLCGLCKIGSCQLGPQLIDGDANRLRRSV